VNARILVTLFFDLDDAYFDLDDFQIIPINDLDDFFKSSKSSKNAQKYTQNASFFDIFKITISTQKTQKTHFSTQKSTQVKKHSSPHPPYIHWRADSLHSQSRGKSNVPYDCLFW